MIYFVFIGSTPERFSGSNHIFSNFYKCQIKYQNTTFHSSDHVFQYKKALCDDKHDVALEIANSTTADNARDIAKKKLNKCLSDNWMNKGRDQIMLEVLKLKFEQNRYFKNKLIECRGREIIHDTESDDYWGTGKYNKGQNKLDKMLMTMAEEENNK